MNGGAMESLKTLDWDILLCDRSLQTRMSHSFERTVYIAREHTVVHVTWGARHRLWGLLPPRAKKRTVERLQLPEYIRNKPELLRFLQKEKPRWL